MPGIMHITNMITRVACGVFLLLFALGASAQQLKLDELKVGSQVYSNVVILRATATDLYFQYEGGIKNVKLKYVPPEIQTRYGYDAKAAEEAERRQLEAEKKPYLPIVEPARGGPPASLPASSEDNLVDPVSERSLLGKAAPALAAEKWLGEKPDLQGKCVVLAFLTSWSVPSRKFVPDLNGLHKRFPGKLLVVGVALQPEAQWTSMTEPRIEFPCAIDASRKLAAAFGVTSVPEIALIDPKGKVHYVGHPAALTEQKLSTLVSQASAQ
jgi:thiol-disulfide isomerase/thioredoxin